MAASRRSFATAKELWGDESLRQGALELNEMEEAAEQPGGLHRWHVERELKRRQEEVRAKAKRAIQAGEFEVLEDMQREMGPARFKEWVLDHFPAIADSWEIPPEENGAEEESDLAAEPAKPETLATLAELLLLAKSLEIEAAE
jgi:hypothetical protein